MSFLDFRGRDVDEVQELLESIYADNDVKIFGRHGGGRTRIYGDDLGDIAQYNVSYSTPFKFLSGSRRQYYLILSCTGGTGISRQENDSVEFTPGVVAAISASRPSLVECHSDFAHISTHIGADMVQKICSNLLGYPIEPSVVFEHRPFSDELKYHWGLVVSSLNRLMNSPETSDIAIDGAVTQAITLLLAQHPHNFSEQLQQPIAVSEHAIRAAKDFADKHAHRPLTVADLAAAAGCSVRALYRGFHDLFGVTPRFYLQTTRRDRSLAGSTPLQRDRPEQEPGSLDGLGHFSDARARGPLQPIHAPLRGHSDPRTTAPLHGTSLSRAKIEFLRHHININLGTKLSVAQLAASVAMSPQNFALAFKRAFNTTPAQYVLLERLRWAQQLLANSNMSIATVASETGFSSQSHLTSAMKQMSGRTPAEVRRSWYYVGMPNASADPRE